MDGRSRTGDPRGGRRMQTVSREVQPGDVIGGKYVIERLLGRGGMGVVFLARQERLDRRVAIKFLLPGAMSNASAVARFEREARAAASLLSDHVTRVHDVGHLETGEPYMVMELLVGEDLAGILLRRGPLPASEVIDVIVQACDAIAEAHSIGIVHRDLKPANIFLVRRPNGIPTVKVLDFGISKAGGTTGASLTGSTTLMGSPLYMSPEQVREARTVDGRADIWALGVTLYELLVGQPPFSAHAVGEICAQILTLEPDRPRRRRPDLPRALDAIVMRCLRKEPSERFGTAGELSAALRLVQVQTAASPTLFFDGAAKSTPPALVSVGPGASSPGSLPPASLLTAEAMSRTHPPAPRPRARKVGVPALAAVGALTVGGAATWALLTTRGPATSVQDLTLDSSAGPQRLLPSGSARAHGSVLPPVQIPSPAREAPASASAIAQAPASAPALSASALPPAPAASPRASPPPIAAHAPQSRREPPEEVAEPTTAPVHAAPHNPLDLPHLP
jgi:serine/threonine-protein kinase